MATPRAPDFDCAGAVDEGGQSDGEVDERIYQDVNTSSVPSSMMSPIYVQGVSGVIQLLFDFIREIRLPSAQSSNWIHRASQFINQ